MIRLVLQNTQGSLPTSTFSLFDDNQEVGFIQIRHRPSHSREVPLGFASHIYYEIKLKFRCRGYGKEILRLGLKEARKIGLKEVTVTCYDDHLASKKIIEANEGVLRGSYVIPDDGKKFLKYTIKL